MPNETVDEMEHDRDVAWAYAVHEWDHLLEQVTGCAWCEAKKAMRAWQKAQRT